VDSGHWAFETHARARRGVNDGPDKSRRTSSKAGVIDGVSDPSGGFFFMAAGFIKPHLPRCVSQAFSEAAEVRERGQRPDDQAHTRF